MTGKTHRVGGMLSALVGYTILQEKGLLINGVNPLLQLTVMYPFSIYGSVVSDLDHHWKSSPSKDIVSYGINKVLHLGTDVRKKQEKLGKKKVSPIVSVFDAKHRSWQTHSDVFLLLLVLGLIYLINSPSMVGANSIILQLVGTGLILGVISHLFLDMLTPEGIWSLILLPFGKKKKGKKEAPKIHLVPNSSFFATGGQWETAVRWVMWFISVLLLIRLIYYMQPYRFDFSM